MLILSSPKILGHIGLIVNRIYIRYVQSLANYIIKKVGFRNIILQQYNSSVKLTFQ